MNGFQGQHHEMVMPFYKSKCLSVSDPISGLPFVNSQRLPVPLLVKATYSENTTVNINNYSLGNIWSPTEDLFINTIMLDICLTWKSTKTQAMTFYILELKLDNIYSNETFPI